MYAARNPFNPGSGLRPHALVGRDDDLKAFEVLLDRAGGARPSRGIVLGGLRGIGKTVLLNAMRDRAESAGQFVVTLEARPDAAGAQSARRILGRDIAAQARRLAPRSKRAGGSVKTALSTVSAFSLKLGAGGMDLGVKVEPGRADSGDIEVDLPELVADLSAALAERGTAFFLFVDEMQDLDTELMRALLVTQHQAGQRGWPFYVVAAGLPHLPGILAEARSYAERLFDYRTVARLSPADAGRALTSPVSAQNASISSAAVKVLVDASDGYPYFLQAYGAAAWEVAPGPVITKADAAAALKLGLDRLDDGFFRARWDRATPAERKVLVAMAADGGNPSATGEVAGRMGIKPTSLSPHRAKLIAKGLIYAPEHGQLAYTVPGMAEYVHRHREDA